MSTTLETVCLAMLAVVIELATSKWVVASRGAGSIKPRHKVLSEKGLEERFAALQQEIVEAKKKLGLAAEAAVTVAYEAGHEGFWLARRLKAAGYAVEVINPVSLQVDRRSRRAKTDRLDAHALVQALWRWLTMDRSALRMVRVLSEEEEDAREWQRERDRLQGRVQSGRDRIIKKLRTHGIWDAGADWRKALREGTLRTALGAPLGVQLQSMLVLELDALELAERQFKALPKGLEQLPAAVSQRIDQLQTLRGIGPVGARALGLKLFCRQFENRRQVGACTGLVGTPYDSGTMRQEQGISKEGDPRLRGLLVELAWLWLMHQPGSALSQWYRQRTQGAGARGRRVMIVAVARRLAIALWRFVTTGELPEGAELKTPRRSLAAA